MIQQKNGLLVQDSMIFKPFDEVWNPGFMPLDMVFKNVQKSLGSIMGLIDLLELWDLIDLWVLRVLLHLLNQVLLG